MQMNGSGIICNGYFLWDATIQNLGTYNNGSYSSSDSPLQVSVSVPSPEIGCRGKASFKSPFTSKSCVVTFYNNGGAYVSPTSYGTVSGFSMKTGTIYSGSSGSATSFYTRYA